MSFRIKSVPLSDTPESNIKKMAPYANITAINVKFWLMYCVYFNNLEAVVATSVKRELKYDFYNHSRLQTRENLSKRFPWMDVTTLNKVT